MADTAVSTAAYERCLERSYLRRRALTMAVSLGESFPRQLAKAVGVDCWRLAALLHGDGKDYAEDLGLVSVGLLQIRQTPHGRVIFATAAGVRKARQVSAREIRREDARRARREARDRLGRGHGPLPAEAPPGATPEVDTQSWRWHVAG
jgi:predicted transcriptional regulator with HTH domain